jgi:hypothetical protein
MVSIGDALKSYVVDFESITDIEYNTILEYAKKQPRKTMTVYRGQYSQKNIKLLNSGFISTTKDERIANRFKDNCCLFAINLINVPVIDVNETIKSINENRSSYNQIILPKDKKNEKEIIVPGGGKFYKYEPLQGFDIEEGFDIDTDGTYYTYYTFPNKTSSRSKSKSRSRNSSKNSSKNSNKSSKSSRSKSSSSNASKTKSKSSRISKSSKNSSRSKGSKTNKVDKLIKKLKKEDVLELYTELDDLNMLDEANSLTQSQKEELIIKINRLIN